MRIVHVFRSPDGGLFRHVLDLAGAQQQAGHAVGLMCDSRYAGRLNEGRLEQAGRQLELGVTRVRMARRPGPQDLLSSALVYRRARRMTPDVVHGHGAKGGLVARVVAGVLRSRGRRVVCVYSPHGGSLHHDENGVGGRLYFAVERGLERLTDALIHVSDYERRVYEEKVGSPRCAAQVIRNGLLVEEARPVVQVAPRFDFVYLGALRELKGVGDFLRSLALVRHDAPTASAVVVGQGSPRDERRYRRLAATLHLESAVQFVAPRPARDAFALANTLVIPSRAESLPYVVLEAAAAGVPMIATDVGGIPEVLGRNCDALTPPGDEEALAQAMKRALTDRASFLHDARTRREIVTRDFSLAASAFRVEELYQAAASNHAR